MDVRERNWKATKKRKITPFFASIIYATPPEPQDEKEKFPAKGSLAPGTY